MLRGRTDRLIRTICSCSVALISLSCDWGEVDGDVRRDGCPVGESCVGELGLGFRGSIPPDLELQAISAPTLYPTAVGGTQELSFSRELFDAVVTSSNEGVLVIESVSSSGFTVRGVAEGSATIRVENASGALYDQITLSVAEVESIELRRRTYVGRADLGWSFFRGAGTVEVVVALFSASGDRVVDDSAVPIESDTFMPWGEYLGELALPEEGDEVRASIRLGSGELREATAPLVGTVDRWVRWGDRQALALAPSIDAEGGSECFIALSGERAVAAAPMGVTGEGPIEVGNTSDSASYGGTCVRLEATGEGGAVLIIRGGGAELRQPISIDL